MLNKEKNKVYRIYQHRKKQDDYCEIKDISKYLTNYIVLLEDKDFYIHGAIDSKEIVEAIKGWLKGRKLRGASTITQQLVKNIYFRFEASYIRKILEMYLAFKFEKILSKDEILELYLNIIYFDNGQYGITNACKFYFNKKPSELSCNQAFFLARILPIVGIYNPLYHPKEFLEFRKNHCNRVLSNRIPKDESEEILAHDETCLDEELCRPTKETKKYDKPGPMINERFGPKQTDSLLEAIKGK